MTNEPIVILLLELIESQQSVRLYLKQLTDVTTALANQIVESHQGVRVQLKQLTEEIHGMARQDTNENGSSPAISHFSTCPEADLFRKPR